MFTDALLKAAHSQLLSSEAAKKEPFMWGILFYFMLGFFQKFKTLGWESIAIQVEGLGWMGHGLDWFVNSVQRSFFIFI